MTPGIIVTGLKAIDLFVPLRAGTSVLVTGEAKSSPRVLGTEIAYRLARHPQRRFRVVVFVDPALADANAYEQEFRLVLADHAEVVQLASVTLEEIRKRRVKQSAFEGDAFFGVSKDAAFVDAFRSAARMARASGDSQLPLTSFVVTEGLTLSGFDTTICLVRALAAEGIYPPIDLGSSTSAAHASGAVEEDRREVADSLRLKIGRLLADLRPGALQNKDWVYNTDPARRPVVQALRFLSQPYFCAEPYTGMKSAFVPLEQTIADFKAIEAGRYADHPPHAFVMKNSLELA